MTNKQEDKAEDAAAKKTNFDKLNDALEYFDPWLDQFSEPHFSLNARTIPSRTMHFPIKSSVGRAQIVKLLRQLNVTGSIKKHTEEIIEILGSMAMTGGRKFQSYTRVAEDNGAIYVNLMNDAGQIVKVGSEGCSIIYESPVRFITPKNSKPLPVPDFDGHISDLKTLVNVASEEDFFMLVGVMINAFFPKGPYPILAINGEQGSAKTTTTKLITSLIDPTVALTRSLPASERDLMVAAKQSWIMCYDNISGIQPWLSDAFCRIATGAGFGIRQNYTDQDEIVFDASRPIIFNGIENTNLRLDLLDRAVLINLPSIKSHQRKSEEELNLLTQALLPRIFGALLNLVSKCLANLPTVQTQELPRMADFAKRVLAIETSIGWEEGEFLPYYRGMIEAASKDAMDGNLVLQGVLAHMQGKNSWEGTAQDLHEQIQIFTDIEKRRYIPAANKLGLMVLKPALRVNGIELEKERTSDKRLIILRRINAIDEDIEMGPFPKIVLNRKL